MSDVNMKSVPGRVPEWTLEDRLRKAREDADLDHVALAFEMGTSVSTVSRYERGVGTHKGIVLKAWALATGVALEWLVNGDALECVELHEQLHDYRARIAAEAAEKSADTTET